MRRRGTIGWVALATTLVLAAPAPAAEPVGAESIAARQRHFGAQNVDPRTGALPPDRVILSWVGVTNFAAAIGGHVVLLDAWVQRGAHSGRVPTSVSELTALRPEAIFIGHGHFDHAADAASIVVNSGAQLVGTNEHCAQVRRQAGPGAMVRCVEATPGAPIGGVRRVNVLDGVEITALRHLHSAVETPDGDDHGGLHVPVVPAPDALTFVRNPVTPQDFAHLIGHLGDEEAGNVLYQFKVRDFVLTWHDTAGPLKERSPASLEALRGLARPDVQVGSIQGFGQLSNGMRDARMYIQALDPKLFVPAHHDDWAPGVTTPGRRYEPFLNDELRRIPEGERPAVRFITDPGDYVRPEALTFAAPAPAAPPGFAISRAFAGTYRLRRASRRLSLRIPSKGTGRLRASLHVDRVRGGPATARRTVRVRVGPNRVVLTLPRGWRPGRYSLRLQTIAPDGATRIVRRTIRLLRR